MLVLMLLKLIWKPETNSSSWAMKIRRFLQYLTLKKELRSWKDSQRISVKKCAIPFWLAALTESDFVSPVVDMVDPPSDHFKANMEAMVVSQSPSCQSICKEARQSDHVISAKGWVTSRADAPRNQLNVGVRLKRVAVLPKTSIVSFPNRGQCIQEKRVVVAANRGEIVPENSVVDVSSRVRVVQKESVGESISLKFKFNSLAPNVSFWESIGTPPDILEVITDGYKLPFKSPSEDPSFSKPNCKMSQEDKIFVAQEILKLLETGAVSRTSALPQVLSPLFVVRNSTKPRLIINLSKLNESLVCPRFKYEDLDFVSKVIPPYGWLTKFDMKSGYHHVSIWPPHRKYLGFAWINSEGDTEYYVFNALPFGLSPAPFIFTKLFRPLVCHWRSKGIGCGLYLDDGLLWSPVFEQCEENTAYVRLTLKRAGVYIEEKKSVLKPVRSLTWLGMEIDLEKATISPTPERILKARESIVYLRKVTTPSLRERLKLTGQLASMWLVLGPKASVFTKRIYTTVCAFEYLDTKVPLSDGECQELTILSQILDAPLSKSLLPPTRVFSFNCDASSYALGVVSRDGETFSRPLTPEEAKESSTFRELLGVFFGLKCFREESKNAEVHVFTDNQNVVPILRKGSMVSILNELTIEIIKELERIKARMVAHWIPRDENKIADLASRIPDKDDWAIMPHIFDKVNKKLGPAHVDRFASCINKKLPRFNSVVPSPGSEGVDAFSENWKGVVNYCVPPVDLLYPTVSFALKGRFSAIVGFPCWPGLPVLNLLKKKDGLWRDEVTEVFRIRKGTNFLIPDSRDLSLFGHSFLKSDFMFVRLF